MKIKTLKKVIEKHIQKGLYKNTTLSQYGDVKLKLAFDMYIIMTGLMEDS